MKLIDLDFIKVEIFYFIIKYFSYDISTAIKIGIDDNVVFCLI